MTEMRDYLKTQTHRMNEDQIDLVERVLQLPSEADAQPRERDRLVLLYMWCHMDSGSVAKRKFPFGEKKR